LHRAAVGELFVKYLEEACGEHPRRLACRPSRQSHGTRLARLGGTVDAGQRQVDGRQATQHGSLHGLWRPGQPLGDVDRVAQIVAFGLHAGAVPVADAAHRMGESRGVERHALEPLDGQIAQDRQTLLRPREGPIQSCDPIELRARIVLWFGEFSKVPRHVHRPSPECISRAPADTRMGAGEALLLLRLNVAVEREVSGTAR
jgi:hypothetical protein